MTKVRQGKKGQIWLSAVGLYKERWEKNPKQFDWLWKYDQWIYHALKIYDVLKKQ